MIFVTDARGQILDMNPAALALLGLPPEAAVEAVTLNPARFFGVDDRLGSVDVGKQANLIILDGEPFRVKTHVVTELIDGKVVDLSNHQTKLFEFYRKKYGIE